MIRSLNQKHTEPPLEAIETCRQITAHHSKTFYFGSRFFGAQQRQAVWAVYAACRTGDDTVDELHGSAARVALENWWERVENAILGRRTSNDAVSVALEWAASQYPITTAPFHELYLGLEMDLSQQRYETLDDLMLYCRRVAGVVGHMIAPIAGYNGGNDTLERALRLGEAMQLTNILRDVGEDLERGRIYIPKDLMRKHGLNEHELTRGQINRAYIALLHELERHARGLYREGWGGIPHLHGPARFAVAMAATAYEGILGSLSSNGYDNFTKRAHVSGRKKLAMIPQAALTLARAAWE